MSDLEDDAVYQNGGSDPVQHDEDAEEEQQGSSPVQERKKGKQRHRDEDDDEEEDDEEDEEDDEEEDEEEEEEDEGAARGRKRQKKQRRHKRSAVNRFLDVEAEVNEEDEEDEEDEEYGRDDFIAAPDAEGEDDDMARRSAANHRLNIREQELNDQDLARIAEEVSQRHKRSAVRYTGDMNEVPQRLLMPSVNDANLWQVRCKPGRERDLVFSLMRKAIDLEYTNHPLQILSAFQRDSLPGMIYVEARSQKQVVEACNGLVGIYPSRQIMLVPIEEMASLLQIKKQDLTVTPGSWVRIKRGKYAGDLAQVMDITENGDEVGLKFIPRIDLNPKDDVMLGGQKRKKGATTMATGVRPAQRFFNYEEVVKVYGRKQISKRNQVYVFQMDTYKDGFIEKDFKLSALQLDDVNPTLDEITKFAKGQDGEGGDHQVDLSIIAEASRKAAIAVLQPGDHVEVFEGEQSGVHGIVDSIAGDVVTVSPVGVELDGQKMQVPARSVRKRFKPGDHVKVMTGKNADETGLVVAVSENIVTFLSDMSMQEVSVFSKDLREAAEVGSGTNIVGNYELHDLVQLDMQTVGVIFKTERDSFRVLDQNGQVRLVQPHQISMRRDSHRAIATDSEGHELRINDNVKEIDGEGRKGRVLHTHQSFFAFLHNRDIAENGGVFVTRARSLASVAPKGNVLKPGTDLSKMNPALNSGGMVGSGNIGRGPRDRLIGVTVIAIKGPYKGYHGTIKDTNGPIARVELNAGNKVITIDKDKLKRRNPNGTIEGPLESTGPLSGYNPRGGGGFPSQGRTPNPYAQPPVGGRTPGWGAPPSSTRTPNPYAEQVGRTPAWNSSSRTPNPYATGNGGKTPAWNASARTPNPYAAANDGGRTPAWNVGSRTPNPYTSGGAPSAPAWGGSPAQPSWGNTGGQTPNQYWQDGGRTPGPAASTSAWGTDANDTWQEPAPTPGMGAPTPYSAPTPAAYGGNAWAPTPGAWNPKTPASHFSGAENGISAPTPAATGIWQASRNENKVAEKDWLSDPAFNQLRIQMVVKVSGTHGGWYNGEWEGQEGIVVAYQPTELPNNKPFATVLLRAHPNALDIPLDHLVPVPPRGKGDYVVGIAGEFKGELLVIVERESADILFMERHSNPGVYNQINERDVCLTEHRPEP